MNDSMVLRMRDVAICLYCSNKNSISLSKIQLQKIIYLLDSISEMFYILSIKNGHHTYFHGPYDKNIQNAADSLVIYGFAEVSNINFLGNSTTSCEYFLAKTGEEWVKQLIDIELNTSFRANIVYYLLKSLISRNLFSELVSLVYAEPIFVKNQRKGYGVNLNFDDLDENDMFNFILMVLDTFEIPKDRKLIPFACDLIINYLDKRRHALAGIDEEEINAREIR